MVPGRPTPSTPLTAVTASFEEGFHEEALERLERVVRRAHELHADLDVTGEIVEVCGASACTSNALSPV